jgi:hypothetical protein
MAIQKNTAIAIVLAIVVVAIFILLGLFGIGRNSFPVQGTQLGGPQDILDELASTGAVASLQTYDIVEGTGTVARSGDRLVVHYTGVLPDGTVFDSSLNRGEPFSFVLGAGGVIQGWDQGLAGMREGGRRLLAIPPSLGYGASGNGPIPPNATIIFEVQLLQVIPAGQ